MEIYVDFSEYQRVYEEGLKAIIIDKLPELLSSDVALSSLQAALAEKSAPSYGEDALRGMISKIAHDLRDGLEEPAEEDEAIDDVAEADIRPLPVDPGLWPEGATHVMALQNGVAFGIYQENTNEMMALKGSHFSEEWRTKKRDSSYYKCFDWVNSSDRDHDILDLDEDARQVLKRDLMFKSPACAASVLSGSARGSNAWVSLQHAPLIARSTKTKATYQSSGQLVRLMD